MEKEIKKKKTPLTTTAKICIFLAGFSNFLLGYALYFVLIDTDEDKAIWFRLGARFFLVIMWLYLLLIIASLIFGFAIPALFLI